LPGFSFATPSPLFCRFQFRLNPAQCAKGIENPGRLVHHTARIRPSGIATHAGTAGEPNLHKFNECPRRGDARVFLRFFIADQKRAPI
jgi:hypothetical protein